MDLKDMLNDGPAEKARRQSPEVKKERQPQPPTPSSQVPQSAQQTPLYAPPSASPSRQQSQSQSQGLTPLQTLHASGSAQHPFSQHLALTPGSAASASQQYRAWDGSSGPPPPSAQPPSRQYPLPPAPPNPPSGVPQSLHSHSGSSLSPTPPSHHSPHSFRQSPLSARSHAPNQPLPQHGYQYQQQHSQPTTPLGPPPFYQRSSSNFPDTHSPFHQRTYSGASNGILSGSPSQHPFGGAHPNESPSAYNRPPPHHRHTSDYMVRERSESVSPKTKVPPRPPSLGSRSSTAHEAYSRGSSIHTNVGPLAGSPNHVILSQPGVAQPTFGQPLNAASEVSHATPIRSQGVPNSFGQNSASQSSLSQANNQRPPLIHHQSSKMGMDHLLTPTNDVAPEMNGSSAQTAGTTMEMRPQQPQVDSHHLTSSNEIPPSMNGSSVQPVGISVEMRQPQQPPYLQVNASPKRLREELGPVPGNNSLSTHHELQSKTGSDELSTGGRPLKRPATEMSDFSEPPSKQRKTRKYSERPIWARLSKHNPKFKQQQGASQANGPPPPPNQIPPETDSRPPWLQNPPLDHDLIHARQVLGVWEKTIKWNTPYPDILRAVQDWLFVELEKLGDVGKDPREGTIEIEAKFGELKHDDRRYNLPVMNAAVIHPQANHNFHFESTMTVAEHSHVNKFLNKTIQGSMQPGRIKMAYRHLHETDSFHNLSQLGQQVLPQSLQRRQGARQPRLRVSRNDTAPGRPVIARIVKIPISNLHIYNPGNRYDCRISINLEVNLDRPDLDLAALISDDKETEVDRKKDRIAYKHLDLYSIDLTKVERQGLEASHELELEVDSTILREHMALLKEGKPNAFGDIVSGFVDNATFLMRERPVPPP